MRRVRLARFPPAQAAALREVARASASGQTYLVGGALRDLLLGRAVGDLDVAVATGGPELARQVARRLGGTCVVLEPGRGAARVLAAQAGARLQIDVSEFRAPTLAGDLAARDFSVNALALSVPVLVRRGEANVEDPAGGLGDLRRRRLRLAGPDALTPDPLRALRGVRLEGELGFRLDPQALRSIRANGGRLREVAPERVCQELVAILRLPAAATALRRADRLGLLAVVLPEVGPMRGVSQPVPHRFDVLEHSFRALAAAERLLSRLSALGPHGPQLVSHLAQSLGGEVTRREILKLAALLHDVAKPETRAVIEGRVRFLGHDLAGAARVEAIGDRLRLPHRGTRVLAALVRHHLRLMHLEQAGRLTRRARYRFFRDLGDDARDLLLLAIADAAAVRGVSPLAVWRRTPLVRDLMAGWRDEESARAAPPLLRGEQVMAVFGLAPGPEVGRLLARAREAQELGLVATPEAALEYLRRVRMSASPGTVV
jgi:putative nucleotidyltransferase with HDIG domain